jgi:hypothetical protein
MLFMASLRTKLNTVLSLHAFSLGHFFALVS